MMNLIPLNQATATQIRDCQLTVHLGVECFTLQEQPRLSQLMSFAENPEVAIEYLYGVLPRYSNKYTISEFDPLPDSLPGEVHLILKNGCTSILVCTISGFGI